MGFGALSVKGRALRYLAQREHSRAELERKLARHVDVAPEATAHAQIVAALDDLAAKDLLSEARAAAAVLNGQGQRYGSRRLRQTLQAKGIEPDLVAATLQAAQGSELARAREVWRRRFGAPAADARERAKQMRFLAGRGFDSDVIRRVLQGSDGTEGRAGVGAAVARPVLQGSMINSSPHCAGSLPRHHLPEMTLPQAAAERQLKHRRQIDVQVFARGNGLWEVDATLTDTKTRVANMIDGPRQPGTPIHEMLLRLVVERTIEHRRSRLRDTRWMPYTGNCGEHGDAYGKPGRAEPAAELPQGAVRERLGRRAGLHPHHRAGADAAHGRRASLCR